MGTIIHIDYKDGIEQLWEIGDKDPVNFINGIAKIYEDNINAEIYQGTFDGWVKTKFVSPNGETLIYYKKL